jgi:diguanylate cyclase (GGDEF)-like protein/putative nucleotidyltransferase with HDIG domain
MGTLPPRARVLQIIITLAGIGVLIHAAKQIGDVPQIALLEFALVLACAVVGLAYFAWESHNLTRQRADEKQRRIDELQQSQKRLGGLYVATIKSLALAIDAKDQYTHQHILRVQKYATAVAEKLGLTGDAYEAVSTGALLHDIGKLGVPEHVLMKPGRLTEEEFAKVKKHPTIGEAILDPVDFPWPVHPIVKHHHERWDGTGYPSGLKGAQTPIGARILAVADVYDALTSNRSYRNAWTHERAIEEIKGLRGSHFDPAIVDAFLDVIERVVKEMAREGYGPLAATSTQRKKISRKADQAARDIRRASSELWALYEVSQTLSSSVGLQETLTILSNKLEALLPGTACLILMKHEREDALMVRAAVGLNREFFEGCRTIGFACPSLIAARKCETYLGDYEPDDLMVNTVSTSEWIKLKAALIVPVVHQGEVLGTINLYSPNLNAFGPDDRQLLEAISARAAMAMYNGILFDRTRSQSNTDPLTGLYNVRYLTGYIDERCRGAMSATSDSDERCEIPDSDDLVQRAGDRFALLCLDLDSFKPINDNFGHQKGDQVLRELSTIFRKTVREHDILSRYGGDEFLVILQDSGQKEAEMMVQRLQMAVERYDPGLNHPKLGALKVGASIGYACFPHDGQSFASLLSVADSQMYSEKTERKLSALVPAGTADTQDERQAAPVPERKAA